jgi:hypothetical protein
MAAPRLAVCLVALVALLAACDTAAPPSATPGSPSPSVDPMEGGFHGTVTDPEGAPIEGAVVQIEQGSFYGTAVTTPEGEFGSRGVHGTFVITVEHLDYDSAIRRVVVQPGELVEVDFTLEPLATP